jgi:hypothetical protein
MATTEQTASEQATIRTLAAIVLALAVQVVVAAVTAAAFWFFGKSYHETAPLWGEAMAAAAGSALGVYAARAVCDKALAPYRRKVVVWAFTAIAGTVIVVPLLDGVADARALLVCAVTVATAWSAFGRAEI